VSSFTSRLFFRLAGLYHSIFLYTRIRYVVQKIKQWKAPSALPVEGILRLAETAKNDNTFISSARFPGEFFYVLRNVETCKPGD